jgi:hypothetical protein
MIVIKPSSNTRFFAAMFAERNGTLLRYRELLNVLFTINSMLFRFRCQVFNVALKNIKRIKDRYEYEELNYLRTYEFSAF